MRYLSAAAVAAAALVTATPALAQDGGAPRATVYGGVSAGYEDLEVDVPGDSGGPIFGGIVGVDFPTSGNVVLGVEGNFHLGTNAIDSDYGVAGRVGYRFPSGGVAYVRGGYQWVNVDVGKLAGVGDIDDDSIGVSDTVDDYLVGVGGEFPLSNSRLRLRVGIDTISFDTVRPTVALVASF